MTAKPSTLIFGGSGKVARHLTRLLVADGHTVHSVIRKPEQESDIRALGATPIVQSIEDASVQDMTATIRQSAASIVIWSAGAGGGDPSRTQKVDFEGAVRSMDATSAAGVKRFLIVSAIDVRNRADSSTEPEWYSDQDRERSEASWDKIGAYMQAKLAADKSLVTENDRRKLSYTILRPGGLSENAGTGHIAAGRVHISPKIPREDVAGTIVEIIRQDAFHCTAFDIVGGDTPIKDAVAQVISSRTDTFKGRF